MDERKTLPLRLWAENDRPREKLIRHGKSVLSDAELLAILIGSGNRHETAVELCRRLLSAQNGSRLSSLARAGLGDLIKFNGIGEAKAVTIIAALELAKRLNAAPDTEISFINSSAKAYHFIRVHLQDLPHEEFYIILLNRASQIIGFTQISKGGVAGTVVDLRMIFKTASEKLASSIILCHNHPSGNLLPSEQDIKLTRKAVEAGKIMDILVADHIIISGKGYFSFADEGML